MPAAIEPSNAITVLALLDETPRSGYDIKQAVDERLEGLVEISAGCVYYTLKKLEQRAWVRGSVSRNGKRPERRTYRITPDGRRGLVALLEQTVLQRDRLFSPFDVALYFTPYVAPDALLKAIDKRCGDLGRDRDRIRAIEEKNPGRWPFHLYYLKEKAKELIDLNERWCQRIRRKIQEKSLERV